LTKKTKQKTIANDQKLRGDANNMSQRNKSVRSGEDDTRRRKSVALTA